jgi:hypothetical protein
VRIVGVPTVQLTGLSDNAVPIQVRNLEMEDDWREVLRHYPMLLSGGASLVEKDGAVYLVTVGSALSERAATVTAHRVAVTFSKGFTIRAVDEAREELIIVERNQSEEVLRDVEAAVQRIGQSATGVVPGLASIGRWHCPDGVRVYVAFAVELRRQSPDCGSVN